MIVLKDFLMGICGSVTVTSVGLGIYYGIKHGSKNEESVEETSNNGNNETEKEEKENEESENESDSSSSIPQPLIPKTPVSDTSGSGDEILIVKK